MSTESNVREILDADKAFDEWMPDFVPDTDRGGHWSDGDMLAAYRAGWAACIQALIDAKQITVSIT